MLTWACHHHEYFTDLCCLDGLMALPQNIRLQACNLQTFEAHSQTAKELLKAWYRLHEQINFLVSHSKSASRPDSMDQAKQYHLDPSLPRICSQLFPHCWSRVLPARIKLRWLALAFSYSFCLVGNAPVVGLTSSLFRRWHRGHAPTVTKKHRAAVQSTWEWLTHLQI